MLVDGAGTCGTEQSDQGGIVRSPNSDPVSVVDSVIKPSCGFPEISELSNPSRRVTTEQLSGNQPDVAP